MSTIMKPRKPLVEIGGQEITNLVAPVTTEVSNNNCNQLSEDDTTVEQYLEYQFEIIMQDFKKHAKTLIEDLRQEYRDGVKSVKDLMDATKSDDKQCVMLKVVAGPHIGQKFRLEATESGDDIYKIGRSTGKQFREKGVSLYKDKEVSTTHAKLELRNGQVFLTDSRSTNGTLLNNTEVEALTPLRLQDGDIICIGSSELLVRITTCDKEQKLEQQEQQQDQQLQEDEQENSTSPKSY